MAQLNIQYPSMLNVLRGVHAIEGANAARTQNLLASKELEEYPEERAYVKEKRSREKEQYQSGKEKEKWDFMLKAFSDVQDQASWTGALDLVSKRFGDEPLKGIKLEYDPSFVDSAKNFVGEASKKGTVTMSKQEGDNWREIEVAPHKAKDYKKDGWSLGKIVQMKSEGQKKGATRQIQRGDQVITEEYDGKQWNTVGQGPKFKPGSAEEKLSPSEKTRRDLLMSELNAKIRQKTELETTAATKENILSKGQPPDPRIPNQIASLDEDIKKLKKELMAIGQKPTGGAPSWRDMLTDEEKKTMKVSTRGAARVQSPSATPPGPAPSQAPASPGLHLQTEGRIGNAITRPMPPRPPQHMVTTTEGTLNKGPNILRMPMPAR